MESLTESFEDYLEAILLSAMKYGKVKAVYVAEHLGISRPAVTKALKFLDTNGYTTKSGNYIVLTEIGSAIANSMYQKKLVLKEFLLKQGVSEETAEKDSNRLKHGLSEESYKAIKRSIGW